MIYAAGAPFDPGSRTIRAFLLSNVLAVSPNMSWKLSLKWLGEANPASADALVRSVPAAVAAATFNIRTHNRYLDGGLRVGVVVTVATALAGMALGRLVSRLADGPVAFYPVWFYFWVEAITATLLFAVG